MNGYGFGILIPPIISWVFHLRYQTWFLVCSYSDSYRSLYLYHEYTSTILTVISLFTSMRSEVLGLSLQLYAWELRSAPGALPLVVIDVQGSGRAWPVAHQLHASRRACAAILVPQRWCTTSIFLAGSQGGLLMPLRVADAAPVRARLPLNHASVMLGEDPERVRMPINILIWICQFCWSSFVGLLHTTLVPDLPFGNPSIHIGSLFFQWFFSHTFHSFVYIIHFSYPWDTTWWVPCKTSPDHLL